MNRACFVEKCIHLSERARWQDMKNLLFSHSELKKNSDTEENITTVKKMKNFMMLLLNWPFATNDTALVYDTNNFFSRGVLEKIIQWT